MGLKIIQVGLNIILVPPILFLAALIVLIVIGLIKIYFSKTSITSSVTELIAVTLILILKSY